MELQPTFLIIENQFLPNNIKFYLMKNFYYYETRKKSTYDLLKIMLKFKNRLDGAQITQK